MDRYTYETRYWLDLRFDADRRAQFGFDYQPYQIIHGVPDGTWTPTHFLMAARLVRLVTILRYLRPASFLDVGGAEGMVADLARGASGCEAVSVDLSQQAGLRAREFFDVPAAAVDSARLPFEDGSFDVVFMSEVLEHLANPIRALAEVKRVTRRFVIVTTEAFAADEAERDRELAERDLEPHMDRSIFCAADLACMFADRKLHLSNQCDRIPVPIPQTNVEVGEALTEVLKGSSLEWPAHGIFVVAAAKGEPFEFPMAWVPDPADIRRVLASFAPRRRERQAVSDLVPEVIRRRWVCPVCRGKIRDGRSQVQCLSCGAAYPVRSGVPAFWTPLEEPFKDSLRERLQHEFPTAPASVERFVALDLKLRLPETPRVMGPELIGPLVTWTPLASVAVNYADDGTFEIKCSSADPSLESPPMCRPRDGLRHMELEVAILEGSAETETLQVFYWTLHWPLYLEIHSSTAMIPNDGAFHLVKLPAPAWLHYEPGDEILKIRLDPSHGPARVKIRRMTLIES